jgi:beta-barrel assembly-enhancing protease
MKHWALLAAVLLLLTAALIWGEVTKAQAPVGPEPILNLIADNQRELTRLPVAFAPLPDSEEIRIGEQLELSYAANFPTSSDDDRAVEAYVQQVGALEAAHAHRKLPYRFHYIPSRDFVNAFALPGGAVFIGGGLISLMDTEDELAAVLGHEIEHIDRYHCAERIQIEAALHHAPAGELVALPVEVFVAGYSKSQELEADREGTKLAVISGYSPQGAIQLFEAFERFNPESRVRAASPQEELSNIALQGLLGYFRSHPSNAERIDQIRKMIADGQLPDRPTTKPIELKPAPLSRVAELSR